MKIALMLAVTTALTGFRPFSAEILETVEIVGEKGKALRINKADFNPDEHTLFADKTVEPKAPETPAAPPAPPATPAPAPAAPPPAPTPATPVEAFVSKKGKKWVVVDKTGTAIAGTDEYDTEDLAKAAHAALSTPAA